MSVPTAIFEAFAFSTRLADDNLILRALFNYFIINIFLGESKWKADREEKMRQLLWETSPELRDLRKLVLMADVTRDQAMQVAEKQAMAELKRQEEESLAVAVEEEKKKYEEELKRKEQLEFQAKLKYHKDLDDLREFKASKDDKNEEMLKREQEAIDEIKRKIDEEDREIARRKLKVKY